MRINFRLTSLFHFLFFFVNIDLPLTAAASRMDQLMQNYTTTFVDAFIERKIIKIIKILLKSDAAKVRELFSSWTLQTFFSLFSYQKQSSNFSKDYNHQLFSFPLLFCPSSHRYCRDMVWKYSSLRNLEKERRGGYLKYKLFSSRYLCKHRRRKRERELERSWKVWLWWLCSERMKFINSLPHL